MIPYQDLYPPADATYRRLLLQISTQPTRQSRNGPVKSCIELPQVLFVTTPLVTLRRTAWRMALREWEWFMSGDPKCPDELLPWWEHQLDPSGEYVAGYGEQLRGMRYGYPHQHDQIASFLDGLRHHPESRRLVLTTWSPADMWRITLLNQNPNTPTTCVPAWANVLTENGIRTVANINPGDKIWDGEKYVTVIAKTSRGEQQVYRLHTRKGSLYLTKTHKVHNGVKLVPAIHAKRVQLNLGKPPGKSYDLEPQHIIDGLVIADGVSTDYPSYRGNQLRLHIGANDLDYFTSEIAHLIGKQTAPTHNPTQYTVTSSISELPRTYERTVPDKYFYGTTIEKRGFLRGYFSGNGCNSTALSIIATSRLLVDQVQTMLNSIGIASSIAERPPKTQEWENGTYISRGTYTLTILREHHRLFHDLIGFIQKYKRPKILKRANRVTTTAKVKDFTPHSVDEVFDITVDSDEHVFWCEGFTISNCHTTLLQAFVRDGTLYFTSYQRSADMLLGVPHNWIQTWGFLLYCARHTGLALGGLRWLFGDAHVYQHPSHLKVLQQFLDVSPDHSRLNGTTQCPALAYTAARSDESVPPFRAAHFEMNGIPEPLITDRPVLL